MLYFFLKMKPEIRNIENENIIGLMKFKVGVLLKTNKIDNLSMRMINKKK